MAIGLRAVKIIAYSLACHCLLIPFPLYSYYYFLALLCLALPYFALLCLNCLFRQFYHALDRAAGLFCYILVNYNFGLHVAEAVAELFKSV